MPFKKLSAVKNTHVSSMYSGFLAIFVIAYSGLVLADTQPDAGSVLAHISTQIPMLMKLVTALAYVLGMYLNVMAVMKLKEYGEQRTQMSKEHSMRTPLIMFGVGSMLLFLPSAVQVGVNTFWTEPNPYTYIKPGATDPWSTLIQDVYLIVQFLGTIAFIRGLLLMNQLGGQQPGTFSRAMSHIIAGVMCINLNGFVSMIYATLGLAQN